MKITLQIIILFLILGCKSNQKIKTLEYQTIDENRISNFKTELEIFTIINELRKVKTDFIAYKKFSVGSIILNNPKNLNNCTNCVSDFPIYLIWSEHENNYLQKFDNCGFFYPIKISNKEILEFMEKNFEEIKTEKFKYYQVDKNTISKLSHSSFKEFLISNEQNEIYNYFDVYNLETNSGKPNLNYEYNQNLKLTRLNEILENEIRELEKLGKFERDLSKCK